MCVSSIGKHEKIKDIMLVLVTNMLSECNLLHGFVHVKDSFVEIGGPGNCA